MRVKKKKMGFEPLIYKGQYLLYTFPHSFAPLSGPFSTLSLKKSMTCLHIFLDQKSIDLTEQQTVSGYVELLIPTTSFVHLSIRVTGQELVYSPYDSTTCFFSQASTPQTHHLEAGLHRIPFCLELDPSLPCSLIHRVGSIGYSISAGAVIGNLAMRAHVKFLITKSQSKVSTIYWGTTPDRKWRYELELPKAISLGDQSVRLTLRLKSLSPISPKLESNGCLLGCQLWEFASVSDPEKAETQHSQSMEPYTHLLTDPSSTWSNPLDLQLAICKRNSHADTKCDRICIKHLFHLTLAFNETADVHLDFPAVVCGELPVAEISLRRDSANDTNEYVDEKLISFV
ncbi:hypothetical protein BGW37DRAFT_560431 [Umbelopsis sp. PMI_123]|nr:hypothetical protein BGW37DRAFT_560431 [Umbelopsis sp. PMI_123]